MKALEMVFTITKENQKKFIGRKYMEKKHILCISGLSELDSEITLHKIKVLIKYLIGQKTYIQVLLLFNQKQLSTTAKERLIKKRQT